MKKRRILPTVIGLTLLAIALPLALTSRAKETPVPERDRVQRVEVAAVEAVESTATLRFSGVLRAEQRAGLSFSVGGRLLSRSVEIGDRVRKGQEVARLDTRELANGADSAAAALAELEARFAQAERERRRVDRLAGANAATDEEQEQAKTAEDALRAALDSGRSRLREARRLLGEGVLRANFTGTVTKIHLEPGEYASAGSMVVEVSGDGSLEVEVGVPEGVVGHLEEGAGVAVELPFANGRQTAGTVRSVGRAAVGSGRLFPVVVAVEDGGSLAAGMTAEVVLAQRYQAATSVPLISIVNPGGSSPAVFRLTDGAVERVAVQVERLVGDRVTVQGPLRAGDPVVVRGHGGLLDGESVEVVRARTETVEARR